jgi:hypothetical protein
LTQITAKLVAVMNAVTEKEGGLNDAHDVLLVTDGPSYWATSAQATVDQSLQASDKSSKLGSSLA